MGQETEKCCLLRILFIGTQTHACRRQMLVVFLCISGSEIAKDHVYIVMFFQTRGIFILIITKLWNVLNNLNQIQFILISPIHNSCSIKEIESQT